MYIFEKHDSKNIPLNPPSKGDFKNTSPHVHTAHGGRLIGVFLRDGVGRAVPSAGPEAGASGSPFEGGLGGCRFSGCFRQVQPPMAHAGTVEPDEFSPAELVD